MTARVDLSSSEAASLAMEREAGRVEQNLVEDGAGRVGGREEPASGEHPRELSSSSKEQSGTSVDVERVRRTRTVLNLSIEKSAEMTVDELPDLP
ncbi:unnamed protein product [Caenorhabditis sp. 36 PRJEB53466]|nr:unnamed protein product [Caenorhabditis sp. 36 PRJEB53466]